MTGFLDLSAGRRRGSPIPLYRKSLVGFDNFDVWEIGFEGSKVGVAFVGLVDVADEPFVDLAGQGAVNFCTADNEDFFFGI